MRRYLPIFLILCYFSVLAQPTGWSVDDILHVSFRYDAGNPWEDESTHWMPGQIAFWQNEDYDLGSSQTATLMNLFTPTQKADLDVQSLVFQDNGSGPFADRVRLDYQGLSFVNGASYGALDARIWGNAGQIDLYTGINGNRIASLGSTALNSNRGNLRLYGPNGGYRVFDAVSSTNFGYGYYYGTNASPNVYIGISNANANAGRIAIYDQNSVAQAGMYINAEGEGIVWGDQKNFRIENPEDDNKDIWYASLEGPEVGAYDRGSATLKNGEAFISFSDHYRVVANSTTMTVTLTPLSWDTYGLAVVEKNELGFRVKELKGGSGNFAFDWEVKCVRKGKENFEVVRDKMEQQVVHHEASDEPGRFQNRVEGRERKARSANHHQHSPNCAHQKK